MEETFILLLLVIPVALFVLAIKNKQQLKNLEFSGRIVEIHAAKRNYALYLTIGILLLIAIILFYLNKIGKL